jgi:hypothetical protein
MPQLDITAYFSEYLWTVISFFTFYYILSKFFLPKFARSLAFEQKKYIETSIGKNRDPFHREKDNIFLTRRAFEKNLFQQSFLNQRVPTPISSTILFQKKTELCTECSQFLELYPAVLSQTKKNPVASHQSFLEETID